MVYDFCYRKEKGLQRKQKRVTMFRERLRSVKKNVSLILMLKNSLVLEGCMLAFHPDQVNVVEPMGEYCSSITFCFLFSIWMYFGYCKIYISSYLLGKTDTFWKERSLSSM